MADFPVVWVNDAIYWAKWLSINPRFHIQRRIGHGKCIAIFFTKSLSSFQSPVRASFASVLKIRCFRWTDHQIYFVARLKNNAYHTVIEERRVPTNRNILADQLILFKGFDCKKCAHPLRKVTAWDKERDREIVKIDAQMSCSSML